MNVVFVTPPAADQKKLIALAEAAWEGGVEAVQLRLPGAAARELFPLAKLLREIADRLGGALYVNDRADVALAAGAAGVHLPGHSLPVAAARAVLPRPFRIGVSCHSVAEALQAETEGADYLFLGPLFETPSKPGAEPLGPEEFGRACREVGIPVFAIGGVTVENAGSALSAGAAGVAVISALAAARSPREAAQELAEAVKSWKGERSPTVDVSE
ncbi:MAG: thiamine phosphate synthase [Candidatus Coatesbacteria bacterium]|nr:MAG: thiamine phosphate synthase [Candidatus Coatesbacteria bacterium]